ncbi:MAG TPA: N,N-dimethylformamidase beta subunit family domain-containing protein [Caulobacteraceae bacterium]|nr:N,N-dimethylformamidase beta subunit family domain-containing protein [Caulobacteraceae bacterium]
MIGCYSDALSAFPGDTVTLFASSTTAAATLEVARVGAGREVVLRREDLSLPDAPTRERPDVNGCGWPAALSFRIGEAWRSGYYDIVLENAAGERCHHFVCVKAPRGGPRAAAALMLTTNTWRAYNWWGGANAYADVTRLMSGELDLDAAMKDAIGVLSSERPFAEPIIAMPPDGPRLMNGGRRGLGQRPRTDRPDLWRAWGLSPYDGAAGFLNKWEHHFVAWAEGEGIALDYLTDGDLDADPAALDGYKALLAVGHSEYWSARQRDVVERFVDAGGGFAILSGNTCYWKVRWEGTRLVCHKWRGFEAEPEGPEATHMWSQPAFGRPEAELTGLSFLFGGYHRLGLCVARGSGAYTVYDHRHWALEGADLFYGDSLGLDVPLLAYENDGCLFQFGDDGLPRAVPRLGVPADLSIIALAPCAYGEDPKSGYRPVIPPEDFAAAAKVAFGDASEASQQRLLRGHAVMASFRRGAGEVFNAGTTEWAYGLKARDPFIETITRNVLRRFGAM